MVRPWQLQAALGNFEGAVGELEAAVKDGLLEEELSTQLMDQLAEDTIQQAVAQECRYHTLIHTFAIVEKPQYLGLSLENAELRLRFSIPPLHAAHLLDQIGIGFAFPTK